MLKSLAKAAGFLAYLFITLEMIFMATPFALYYYSVYSPVLASFNHPATAWLAAFFLPHLSTKFLLRIGVLIVLVGLVGFLLSAFQLYYAKFRRRGVVQSAFYKRIRHPQYLFLALAGLGLLIVWPRFILLIAYINMLWFYYLLALSEERRMEARYGDAYRGERQRTWMFLPGEPGGRMQQRLFWVDTQSSSEIDCHLRCLHPYCDRRGIRAAQSQPRPDHTCGLAGAEDRSGVVSIRG